MTRKSRPLSEDERVLWSTVTRSIAPLKARRVVKDTPDVAAIEAKPKPQPRPKLETSSPPAKAPLQRPAAPPLAPMDRRTRQKLARGTTEIGGRLDLHGLTQDEAHAALSRFLRHAQAREVKVVLVITGKGGTNPETGRGVLKRQVPFWLEGGEFRPFVIGFQNAAMGHGGAGALYVRVRRAR